MQMEQLEKREKQSIPRSLYEWCCRWEAYISTIVLALVITYAIWPLLCAPANTYPVTADGLGHLTKIKYIADNFKNMQWSSWFPYWYNGASVVQYYPPLAYFVLVPIQMLFDDVMMTFKFLCFFSLFIGGIGVWYTCNRFIGPLAGILGAVIYILQPFLSRLILYHGAVAQGPIIALTPWFLLVSLLFLEKKTPLRWIAICILSSGLILSHAMHAFLISLSTAFVVITVFALRKISFRDIVLWVLAVALGAGLVSFWWLPGVTQLELPGVPYLLPEAAENWTADINWFNPLVKGQMFIGLYFSLPVLIVSLLAVFLTRKNDFKTQKTHDRLKIFIPLFIAFVITTLLSFGNHLAFYRYIPMSSNLVPGRILTFSALAGAILVTVFIYRIITRWNQGYLRLLSLPICAAIILIIFIDINPYLYKIDTKSYTEIQTEIEVLPSQKEVFENGRIFWSWMPGSESNYFSMLNNLSITSGWNPEGSSHFRTLLLHNIAIPGGYSDYVVKNLLQWNTRYVFLDHAHSELTESLISNGFELIKDDKTKAVLFNSIPSSYFMRQERNAIAIGRASPGLIMTFPWLVQGYSSYLEDYSEKYLSRFSLIYLVEPEVRSFNKFEEILGKLAGEGKTVIVEMGRAENWPVLGIVPYWETIVSGAEILPINDSPFEQRFILDADPKGRASALGNLDEVWMEVKMGEKHLPALGYKYSGGNRVYFLGLALSQQLESSLKWSRGVNAKSSSGDDIKDLLEQLMDLAEPHKSIVPAAFPVKESEWGHDGFSFKYSAEKDTPVQVSVTYTPRWLASIDGKPLKVNNLENLILIDLPAGEHQVSFHYGMTWVGWLGIGLSIISLLLLIFIYCKFHDIDRFFDYLQSGIKKLVESIGA